MARIRIVDEWLRSPVSAPTRYRSVMVVADAWAEQRVLMRAYQTCPDQTRPTIVLHGAELAIGPAGMEPYGAWGIHVEPPVDGRAQELRGQLELAARRMAGSKGNPPRLEDEAPRADARRTGVWLPDTPPQAGYYEPQIAAASQTVNIVVGGGGRGWTSPVTPSPAVEVAAAAPREAGAGTVHGFATGPTRRKPATVPPPGVTRRKSPTMPPPGEVLPRRLEKLVNRTLPMGFQLSAPEREVLNALGEVPYLTARKIGEIARVGDPVGWMEQLMTKLGEIGLELVIPGDAIGGEPTYRLRR